MKKRSIIVAVVGIVLIGLIYSGVKLYMVNSSENELKEATVSHLEGQGYNIDEDIQKIRLVNATDSDVADRVVVIFEDETGVEYFYTRAEGSENIIQDGYNNKTGKEELIHLEE